MRFSSEFKNSSWLLSEELWPEAQDKACVVFAFDDSCLIILRPNQLWNRLTTLTSFKHNILQVLYAAWAIFQFGNHRVSEMEQSGLLAGAFERLSLFEVSLQPCRVQNTLSRDTIKLGSYWFLPKSDIRHTEHVKNFQIRFLIVYVFQKPTRITVLLSQFEKGAFGQSDTVSCQYFYFSLKNFILRTLMHKCARRRAFLVSLWQI